MNKFKNIIKICCVAAIYTLLNIIALPISFGPIQFRISECLLLLILLDYRYGYGLLLGTFLSNLFFSPLNIIDAIFGTIATLIIILINLKIKNYWLLIGSSSIVNAIIIGFEFLVFGGEGLSIIVFLEVFIGELLVLLFLGYPLKLLLSKNKAFIRLLTIE